MLITIIFTIIYVNISYAETGMKFMGASLRYSNPIKLSAEAIWDVVIAEEPLYYSTNGVDPILITEVGLAGGIIGIGGGFKSAGPEIGSLSIIGTAPPVSG